MARYGVIGVGFFLLILTGIGYFNPTGPQQYTVPQLNDLCIAGYFENAWIALGGKMMFGKNWEQLIAQECDNLAVMTGGIYLLGISGVVVMGIGWYMKSKKATSSLDILRVRYAKGEITKDEFEQMKKDLGDGKHDDGNPTGVTYKHD